jgi:hypothetical protein
MRDMGIPPLTTESRSGNSGRLRAPQAQDEVASDATAERLGRIYQSAEEVVQKIRERFAAKVQIARPAWPGQLSDLC